MALILFPAYLVWVAFGAPGHEDMYLRHGDLIFFGVAFGVLFAMTARFVFGPKLPDEPIGVPIGIERIPHSKFP